VRLILDLGLPDALGVELETEAKRCGMSAPKWAAELIEAEVAVRRLPYVDAGRNGARMYEAESEIRKHRISIPEKE
jgi:hypothetical protein